MAIFSQIRAPVQAMVAELMSDPTFREQITYKRYTGQTFDGSLGYTINTYQETGLYAVRMRHNQNSVKVSTSDVEVGDVLFLFDGVTFPEDTSLKDVIEDVDGNTLGIKGIDPVFDMAVIVTVVSSS
jgi:hypothetical protein